MRPVVVQASGVVAERRYKHGHGSSTQRLAPVRRADDGKARNISNDAACRVGRVHFVCR